MRDIANKIREQRANLLKNGPVVRSRSSSAEGRDEMRK